MKKGKTGSKGGSKCRHGLRLVFGMMLSAALIAVPVSAAPATPQDVTITIHRLAAIPGGTWSATGGITDSGAFAPCSGTLGSQKTRASAVGLDLALLVHRPHSSLVYFLAFRGLGG